MIVQANSHLGFYCRDLDRSVKFYEEILGCREKFSLYYGDMIPEDPEDLPKMPEEVRTKLDAVRDVRWIVYLEWKDGYFIELFNELDAWKENPFDPEKYGYTHFSFVVDDIHAFYQELIGKGAGDCIDIVPQLNCDHTWALWFHDPDGNRIEVHQYTDRSFQVVGRNGSGKAF